EKDYIVAALSHDLKTPLTVIQAYTEALHKESRLTIKEKKEYEIILFEKLKYMKQLIDDLVMYNSLQSKEIELELVEVEGEEFFDMLLSGYDETAAAQGVSLIVEHEVKESYYLNVNQMVRVMDN
ncbi:histidine kinase dimerization/phospho-acceptor domain-containing protein, partial [Pseudomonas sp. 2995-3]|uniref:histidine kinase dimerization/phospho-acceptor domain-containing protein n=1 Tax=Pseudomonas sp. 2995-3 TaxID=1712680 RepID=UPI000C5FB3A0